VGEAPKQSGVALPGSVVKVYYNGDKSDTETFLIATRQEGVNEGKLEVFSPLSPLGGALIDAKVGDGAFMKSIEDARALAETMLDLGRRAGREVVCLLTDMNQPLGCAVGNALEIREAIATVRGEGPPDFLELVLAACSRLLAVSDLGIDEQEGRVRAMQAIADGSALEAYERWISAQGSTSAMPARTERTASTPSDGASRPKKSI